MQKNWDSTFKVKVRAYGNKIMTVSTLSSKQRIYFYLFFILSFSAALGSVVEHHKPKYTLKICYSCIKSQWFKMPDDILLTAAPLVTELGTVTHREPQSASV